MRKLIAIFVFIFFLANVSPAISMSGACYQDRAPGGCYERTTAQEKINKQSKSRYQDFISLMQQVPASAIPSLCKVSPNPRNGYATMAPEQNLTPDQIQTCIDAANKWVAQDRQRKDKQIEKAAKEAKWKILKADNGATYQIDLNSIRPWDSSGAVEAVVYIDEGSPFNPTNMKRMLFDCRGHMTDISGGNGPTIYLPPLSVGGRLAEMACGGKGKNISETPAPNVNSKPVSPVLEAFTQCLLAHGQDGSYTSSDGGKSAVRLMADTCKQEWGAWQNECIAKGGTDGGMGGCTMQAGIMAQSALKLLGK